MARRKIPKRYAMAIRALADGEGRPRKADDRRIARWLG